MHRHFLFLYIFSFLIIALPCHCSYDWTLKWESGFARRTEGPSLWNGQISWSSNPNYDIWYNDLFFWDGNQVRQLTDTPWINEASTSLYDGKIAYSGDPQGIWQGFYWDGEKHEQITFGDGKRSMSSLWGNMIAYPSKESETNWDIYYFDIETRETTRISNTSFYDMYVSSYEGTIAWLGGIGGYGNQYDVYYWDGNSTIMIPSRAAYWKLSLYNGQIAWAEVSGYGDDHTIDMMLWDATTGIKIRLPSSANINVEPSLFKGMMAFVAFDGHTDQVMLWDGNRIWQVTNDNYKNRYPSLYITDSGEIQLAYVRYTNWEIFEGQIVYLTGFQSVPEPSVFILFFTAILGVIFKKHRTK